MKFKYLVGLSLLVHLLFVLSLSYENPKKQKEVKSQQTEVKFLVEEKKTRPSDLKSDSYYKNSEQEDQICSGKDKNYIGVGMVIQPGTGRVISVPAGYPAYKAGIRLGDVIADPYSPSLVNGFISFSVESGNTSKIVKIKPERICYK